MELIPVLIPLSQILPLSRISFPGSSHGCFPQDLHYILLHQRGLSLPPLPIMGGQEVSDAVIK